MRRFGLKAMILAICAASGTSSGKTQPQTELAFDVTGLPVGKNVTIPRPATTLIPLASTVHLTGTDLPQTISFKPVNLREPYAAPVSLVILDHKAKTLAKVTLQQQTPYLFSVKDLRPITVRVEGGGESHLKLKVESDKPLEIGR